MIVIKSANARNVIPFPVRVAEPLLIDRLAEVNRCQLEANRLLRARAVVWACVYLVGAMVSALVGWWLAS